MLRFAVGVKQILTQGALLFFAWLLGCANLNAAEITIKPIVWYQDLSGGGARGPTVDAIIGLRRDAQQQTPCYPGPSSPSSFAEFTWSSSKTPGVLFANGLPSFYYNVGESWGTCPFPQDKTQSIPYHHQGITVQVIQECKWPFSVRYDESNKTLTCVYTPPEEEKCGSGSVGNPISLATGTKFEQEVDYSSADGSLKVERIYGSQDKGWAIDRPIQLSIVSPGTTAIYPKFLAYKFVYLFTKRLNVDPAETYEYVYGIELINRTQAEEVYLWQGRQQARFSENASGFTSEDPLARNASLIKINAANALPEKWLLTLANGDKHYFAADGLVRHTEFASGGRISYEFSGGNLVRKTDQSGRSISYSYDEHNRLIAVTPPDGKAITYTYGSNKDLASFNFLSRVTWADGESVGYLYNEPANMLNSNGGPVSKIALTGKLDSNGLRIGNYQYYSDKAVLTEGFSGINKKQLSFSPYNTQVTDALNSTRSYNYIISGAQEKQLSGTSQPAGSGCNASTKTIDYYASTDLKKSETDFNGHKIQYAYDMNRKLETVRVEGVPAGNNSDYLPANSQLARGVRKFTQQWHGQLNKPVKTSEPRLITTFVYNGDVDPFNGNAVAQCAPVAAPLLCHKIQQATTDVNGAEGLSAALDAAANNREWLYSYNERGQLLTSSRAVRGSAEETREYYEVTSSSAHKGDLKKISNALGQHTDFTQYDENGRLLRMLDMNGVESQYSYDQRGRLKSQSIASAPPTTYTYDLNGNRIKSILPNGVALNYRYDPMHRLTSIENTLGDRINYEYDLESNLRFERVTNASGAIGYIKEHIYDALSREKNTVNSFGQSQTHLYDANGNPTGKIDAKQQAAAQSYDALSQLNIASDALNGKTEYSYDGQGRIAQVKDARGNATHYTYNAFGDLTSQASPDTGATTFSYDAIGNRTSATDARGVVVNYTYDALNRLRSVSYPAASGENVIYGYDDMASGVWGTNYGVGRLTSIGNSRAIITYIYNEFGLIKIKRAAVNGIAFVTAYSYDSAGDLASMTYPSGRIVNYTRDNAGRVQSIKTKLNAGAAEQTVVSGISYLPFGPASNYTFGNGLSHTAIYDNDYRLTSIQVGGILSRSYSYDPVDNITGISDLMAASKNQKFSYDALNRLASATGVYGVLGYTYDALGNRLSEKTDRGATHRNDIYNYSPVSNRLTSISQTNNGVASGSRSFSYDNAGNRIRGVAAEGQAQTYTYNKANRLETAQVAGALAGTYIYNAVGQRVSKTLAGGNKELYQYNESGQLIAVADAAGKNLREYIYSGEQLVGFVGAGAASNSSSSAASARRSSSSSAASTAAITLDETTASFIGGHSVGSTFAGFTGSGFIDYSGEGQVNWPLAVVASRNYTIAVRYALAGTASRPLALLVDAVQKATFNARPTASWTTWATETQTVALTAGRHTISLKTTGQSGPNIDRMDIVAAAIAASSLGSSSASPRRSSSSSLSRAASSRLSSSNSSSSGPSQAPVATLYFVHSDHLGTPQVVTDKNQAVVFMADYQPFGKLQSNQTNSIELYSRFPGQYLDGETGLYYNYFRDYDPSVGRYIESDPIGLDGGINTYAYVSGNPLSYSDPTGQMAGALVSGATVLMAGILVCSATHCLDESGKAMTDVAERLWDEARGSGKERATDVPSWARGKSPNPNESCDDYASRILKDQYGCDDPRANRRGPGSEHSKIKKYCERGGR